MTLDDHSLTPETDPEVAAILRALPGALVRERPLVEKPEEFKFVFTAPSWERISPDDAHMPYRLQIMRVPSTTATIETHFAIDGVNAHANGWSVIPQERDGKRLPSRFQRETIQWSKYQEEKAPTELVYEWAWDLFSKNTAIILGNSSGNVWALDIDVKDSTLCRRVEFLACKILGETLFRRVGNWPKCALLFRAATPEDLPRNSSFAISGADGKPSEHMIELLGHRRMLTAFGRHHFTNDRFSWIRDYHPAKRPPSDVPAVTQDQISQFLAAADEQFGLWYGKTRLRDRRTAVSIDFDEIEDCADLRRPKPRLDIDYSHRKAAILARSATWSTLNAGIVSPHVGGQRVVNEEGVARIAELVLAEVAEQADLGYATEMYRQRAIEATRGAAQKIASGEWTPKGRPITAPAKADDITHAFKSVRDDTAGHAWLPEARNAIAKRVGASFGSSPASLAAASSLAITSSAETVRDELSAKLRQWIGGFLTNARRRVAEAEADQAPELLTDLIRIPAGGGKTFATIDAIAQHRDPFHPEPILFLTPSYENALEVVQLARSRGLRVTLIEGEIRSGRVDDEGRARGVEPAIPGCHQWKRKQQLADAGLSGHGLCKAEKRRTDEEKKAGVEPTFSYCPMFAACRAHRARAAVAESDLVVAVHAYVTAHKPAELDLCKLVVIDEAISDRIVGSCTFKVADVMKVGRNLARLTKKDRAANRDHSEFAEDRDRCWQLVLPVLKAGGDPARVFAQAAREFDGRLLSEKLDQTIALLSRTDGDVAIHPKIPDAALDEICRRPTKTLIGPELAFWRIVRERVEPLSHYLTHRDLAAEGIIPAPSDATSVLGATDRRIHYYRDGTVRVAWRSDYNFADRHLLLLDASADPAILERTLGRQVTVHEVGAPMRLRTVWMPGRTLSKSSLLPKKGETAEAKAARMAVVVEIRETLSVIAAMHVGGVLAVAPKAVRSLICRGWAPPRNVGWMHFGATRGLNWASRYEAVVTVGCIQPSAEAVDAKVAALTYDQPTQEPMIDPIGSDRTDDDERAGMTSINRTIRMRSGRLITVPQRIPSHPLAAAVFEQVRREETLQAIARVRPVLRDEISTYYCLGDYIPDSIVVDEVLPCDDLVRTFGSALDLARREGGYVGEHADTDQDAAAAERTIRYLETTPTAARALHQIRFGDTVRWYPAFNSGAAIVASECDDAEPIHAPAEVEIGRPSGWDDMRDLRAARREEIAIVDAAIGHAERGGWTRDGVSGTCRLVYDGWIWEIGYRTLLACYVPDNDDHADETEAIAA